MLTSTQRRLMGLVLAAISLAGCAKFGSVATTASDHGTTLRVGVVDEPDSLNPLFSHTVVADDVAALVFAPLFRYDVHGALVSELAERIPTVENGDFAADGRRITLRLRAGLHWADGAPLDVRDIVFTWHAVMDARNAVKLRAGWSNITRIDTPNRTTAVVHLATPDATILAVFAGGGDAAYPVLPAHLLAHGGDLNHAAFNAHPLSSGPWILSHWNHGSDLTFVPNVKYWRGRPLLDHLTLRVEADSQTLMTSLLTHDVDIAFSVPVEALHAVGSTSALQIITHPVAAYRHLDFNCSDAILSDGRVRGAINAAINWPEILHTVYRDHGELAVSDIYPSSWAAPHLPEYAYDQLAAERDLTRAGWLKNAQGMREKNGVPLRLTLMSGTGNPLSTRVETLIVNHLARIGVDIIIKNAPSSYLFAQDGPLYRGTYQLAWMSDTRAPDPDNSSSWSSTAIPPNGANTVFLRDALVDSTALAARATANESARRTLYQTEETRLHALVPSRTFAWQRETIVSDGHVFGLKPATYYSSFWNSWEWQHGTSTHADL